MTTYHDHPYLQLVKYGLEYGIEKENRTGKNTFATFGQQMRFNLRDGTIPMLTTKKMFTRGIIHEILWYLQGGDNVKYLQDNKVTIWDEWARPDGSLGPVYGYQWRKWPTFEFTSGDDAGAVIRHCRIGSVDQIANLIHKLKTNPDDRRLLVSAWNVGQLNEMALPPCHYTFQCFTRKLSVQERLRVAGKTYNPNEILEMVPEDGLVHFLDEAGIPTRELSLMLNQRSCDIGLGVPFNIVQYSIMLRMFAEVTNMVPGEFIWNGGDVHIYHDHVEGLKEQITRKPYASPTFKFARKLTSIDDFKYEDFVIENYTCHPKIELEVAI